MLQRYNGLVNKKFSYKIVFFGKEKQMIINIAGDDFPIIEIEGEIDHYYAPQLESFVLSTIKNSPDKSIIIDLSSVSYLDSAGVGVLFSAVDLIKKSSPGKSIVTICPNKNVEKILKLVGIQTEPVFVLTEEKEKAISLTKGK